MSKKKRHIRKIRKEKGDTIAQFYTNKLEYIDEMHSFLENINEE